MKRKQFLKLGCSCGMLSIVDVNALSAEDTGSTQTANVPQEMSADQVKNIVKYMDTFPDEEVKKEFFGRLGYECFHARNLDDWIGQYTDNVQGFLDRINVEKTSKYWERLKFNEDKTVLTLTGRKVSGCACAFADCPDPPKSLCYHCCKNFQQEMFGMLLGRKVEVEITSGYLLGDDHCDTVIRLV